MALDSNKSPLVTLLEQWRNQSGEKRLDPLVLIGGPGTGKSTLARVLADLIGGPNTPIFREINRRDILAAAGKGLPIIIEDQRHLPTEDREFLWMLGHRGQNIVYESKHGVTGEMTLPTPVLVVITAQNNYLCHEADTRFEVKLPYIPLAAREVVTTAYRKLKHELEPYIYALKK